MKQTITVLMTIFIYIGTIGLIDTSIAAGHHGKDGHHHGKPNPKMLFHGLDIDKEQKDQIKMIMGEQMEKGKAIRLETRDRLSKILTAEQMTQFDRNVERAENKITKKSRKRGKKHKKHNKEDRR